MCDSYPPPPSYDQVRKRSDSTNSNKNVHKWYRKFIELEFTAQESNEYAKLFANNEIETSMIPELNDSVLKSIGIEKAGHRIRILRLQNKAPRTTAVPVTNVIATPVNTPRCANHPNMVANEKCRKCNKLICLNCRRDKPGDGGRRYYCPECYDECTLL